MKRVAALAWILASCSPRSTPTAIDSRLWTHVPTDASAVVGFRPHAMGSVASSFGDARYVLAWVRGAEVSSAILAADGSVSGPEKSTSSISPLQADAETLAAQYPAWAVIRGGARLPLQGNLANLNNLLVDPDLVTIGVRGGEGYAVELTARCPSEDRARHFEGGLRAVLLLLQAASSAQVQREGNTVRASMTVPAELLGKFGQR